MFWSADSCGGGTEKSGFRVKARRLKVKRWLSKYINGLGKRFEGLKE